MAGNNMAYKGDSHDAVNHPRHYMSNGIEAIDVIESFTDELHGVYAVLTAQVIKYILRWNKKGGVEDLKKARWYLERLINKLDKTTLDKE